MKIKFLVIFGLAALTFAACQTEQSDLQIDDFDQAPRANNIPYSIPPTDPPQQNVVPTTPPPTAVMTQNEDIELSLPEDLGEEAPSEDL